MKVVPVGAKSDVIAVSFASESAGLVIISIAVSSRASLLEDG